MPDDATEGVAEHSSRLQPSINLHAPVTAFLHGCICTFLSIFFTQFKTSEMLKSHVFI